MALTSVYGASKFIAAAMTGDIADDATVDARRAVCFTCPNRVRKVAPLALAESDWCGQVPGEPEKPGTCSCLIPAKTIVGSSVCPSGKW